jgi:hypothetical protein
MVEYKWSFGPMEVAPVEGKFENVVKVVPWTLTATDGERSEAMSGNCELPPPDASDFTPFEKLTEAEVVEWIEGCADIERFKVALAESLAGPADDATPALVMMAPPFQKDEA